MDNERTEVRDDEGNLIDIPTHNKPIEIGTNVPIHIETHKSLEKNGIMADPSRRGRFPGSRDWDLEGLNISCFRKTCIANNDKTHKCTMPSLIAINEKGKCKGDRSKKKSKADPQDWRDIL